MRSEANTSASALQIWGALNSPVITRVLNLFSVISLALGFGGWIVDLVPNAWAFAFVVVGVIPLVAQGLVLATRHSSSLAPEETPDEPPVPPDPDSVDREIEDALVELIEEWRTLRPSEFEETRWSAYRFLKDRTASFLGSVLGDTERQRFEADGGDRVATVNGLVDRRIAALESLRDRPQDWRRMVDARGLSSAVTERGKLDYADAMLIVDSPIADLYEMPAPPGSSALTAEQTVQESQGQEDVAPSESPSDPRSRLKVELQAERRDGRRLLAALKGGLTQIWQYDRVPDATDVDGWAANVEHLLREEHQLLSLFTYSPLQLGMRLNLSSVLDHWTGGPAARRLERMLTQLDKVIARLED